MSAINFYLGRGLSPIAKTTSISGADTIAVWTPVTGKRVTVTNLSMMGGPLDTTISFFFADKQNPVAKIATFGLQSSINTSPNIGCWESTAVSGAIFARKTATLGEIIVNLSGFEVD